jgi:hypothetical protein
MARDDDRERARKEKVPYFKYAFHNLYNYTALGGVGAAALLTQNWWLAVVGGGLEALWMVFAPDSRLLRRFWFDKVHDEKMSAAENAEKVRLLAGLPAPDADRYHRLAELRIEINRLCNENPKFTSELLKGELTKLDQLVDSFLDLMTSSYKHETYLQSIDVDDLENDLKKYTRLSEQAKDEDARKLAERNLEVLTQRRERIAEIRRFVSKAYGQMDLIENTFRLLADQIVTMHSPRELGGQLDGLIDGVEAVRSTARETEAFVQSVTS